MIPELVSGRRLATELLIPKHGKRQARTARDRFVPIDAGQAGTLRFDGLCSFIRFAVRAAIGCVLWRTSNAVAQRVLALDIYYETTATPRRSSTTRRAPAATMDDVWWRARTDRSRKPVKRALITGITGQDGSYLAELLLSKGYEVH